MSRSFFFERIWISAEICFENVSDSLGSSLRKPLMVLAGMALVMTLRSARRGVQNMKRSGLTSGDAPWMRGASQKNKPGGYGSYGSKSNMFGSNKPGGQPLGGSNSAGGVTKYNPALYGKQTPGATSNMAATTPGTGGALGTANPPGGTTPSSNFGAAAATTPMARALSNGLTLSTSQLVDQHGAAVRVLDATQFRDFGGTVGFYGQVETLQAIEGSGVVEKVLQSPGQGKILVVDGGANLRSAIFGKTAAETAQRNGWKGVVIHGVVREASSFESLPIGVKALGSYPRKGVASSGSKSVGLNIAGMQVSPGMWMYCDKDGIVISDQQLTTGGAPASTGFVATTPGTATTTNTIGATPATGTYPTGQATGFGQQQNTGAGMLTGAPGTFGQQQQQQPLQSQQQQQPETQAGFGTAGGQFGAAAGQQQQQQQQQQQSGFAPAAGGNTGAYGTYGTTNKFGQTSNTNGGFGQPQQKQQQQRGPNGQYPYSHAGARPYSAGNSVCTGLVCSLSIVILALVSV